MVIVAVRDLLRQDYLGVNLQVIGLVFISEAARFREGDRRQRL